MERIIEKWGISCLFHFTDRSNLKNIEKYGLLSLEKIKSNNITINCFGANDWSHDADRRKELHRYVHLSFKRNHPMLYKKKQSGEIKDPVILTICPSVMLDQDTLFTADVSNKSGVSTFKFELFEDKIDCEVLFTRTNWKDEIIKKRLKQAEKSEILISNHIPWSKVIEVKNG